MKSICNWAHVVVAFEIEFIKNHKGFFLKKKNEKENKKKLCEREVFMGIDLSFLCHYLY
jgi:hypothetical protein